MTLDCEVVLTTNGVHAMRDRSSGEVMHPVVGPALEAERLYLSPSRLAQRLDEPAAEPLLLLDVGLGAGSNAIAAWSLSEQRSFAERGLDIVSFDRSTAALELAAAPQHRAAYGLDGSAGGAVHALLQQSQAAGLYTRWRLSRGVLPATLALEPAGTADVVFWDPFSPAANPELWTWQAFRALRRLCRAGATVHTYSGATSTRSALLLAGFAVGVGEVIGPGKAATVAATRVDELKQPLDGRWLERLTRSSAPFPADAPADSLEQIRALPQFR